MPEASTEASMEVVEDAAKVTSTEASMKAFHGIFHGSASTEISTD